MPHLLNPQSHAIAVLQDDGIPVGSERSAAITTKPRVTIQRVGRNLEALADAPEGYSWDGLHQLVVCWIGSRDTCGIREAIHARIAEMGKLTPCPQDCECRD